MSRYRYAKKGPSKGVVIGGCILLILFLIAWFALWAAVFTFVWNIAVPAIFGGPTISYEVGLAAVVLLSIIGSAFRSYTTKS